MNDELRDRLVKFTVEKKFKGKGVLSLALVLTDRARTLNFPIDPDQLLAKRSRGQVAGLSATAAQKVLAKHRVFRRLSIEGGRTNRGSISNMRAYIAFLNELSKDGLADLGLIECFWVDQIKAYFASKPFKLKIDMSQGLRPIVRHILRQASDRQKESTGMNYAGAVMQHLVGAKLTCALGQGQVVHHSFSTADQQSNRAGDFLIGQTVIHVTTSPSESLIRKCSDNLDAGLRPIVITGQRGTVVVDQLAENAQLRDRIDVFEIEQFVALNIYEIGKFVLEGHRATIGEIIKNYNHIVSDVETDPSLAIEA